MNLGKNKTENGLLNKVFNSPSYKDYVAASQVVSKRTTKSAILLLIVTLIILTANAVFFYSPELIPPLLQGVSSAAMIILSITLIVLTVVALVITNDMNHADHFKAIFAANEQVFLDEFLSGLSEIDQLYKDSSIAKPVRVAVDPKDVIKTDFAVNYELGRIYAIFKLDGLTLRVTQYLTFIDRKRNGVYDLDISKYKVGRMSEDDLVTEFKYEAALYQQYFMLASNDE